MVRGKWTSCNQELRSIRSLATLHVVPMSLSCCFVADSNPQKSTDLGCGPASAMKVIMNVDIAIPLDLSWRRDGILIASVEGKGHAIV
jgi:hypothetical protein